MASGTPTSEPRWRRSPGERYVWAHWGEESALYDRVSGRTHFLNLAGVVLLDELLATSVSAANAAQELHCPLEDARSMLLRFEELGLVERA